MWKAGVDVKVSNTEADDDEWETDPDFVVRFPMMGWGHVMSMNNNNKLASIFRKFILIDCY